MRRLTVAASFSVLLLLGVGPAAHASHSQQAEYTIGIVDALYYQVGCVHTCPVVGEAAHIGGYVFEGPAGETAAFVTVADRSRGNVEIFVRQNLDGDRFWGEEGEGAAWVPCGTAIDLADPYRTSPFRPGGQIWVGVYFDSLNCPGGFGLGGTITMTWGIAT